NILRCNFTPSNFLNAYFESLPNNSVRADTATNTSAIQLSVRKTSTGVIQLSGGGISTKRPHETLPYEVAKINTGRIYFLNAERLNIAKSGLAANLQLAGNAANLAQVLNQLRSQIPEQADELDKLIHTIFPSVSRITAPLEGDGQAHIKVWSTAHPGREDLAIELSDSGTGIGQVLAILFVVLTANFPRIFVIDEPQSFLHPGAIRKLFEILRQEFPQHQYIITTHSPTALTAAEPKALLLIRKAGAESTVTQLDDTNLEQTHLCLSELGVRLSDVFGGDNVLWVEGDTEKKCFPKILSKITKRPVLGTLILGVIQVGDFEVKHVQKSIEIYSRLSDAHGLIPQILGFIFDAELRSAKQMDDLIRSSKGTVHFLPRRMYENYLLNPEAIASVMSDIEDFSQTEINPHEVTNWLNQDRWDDERLFERNIPTEKRTPETWLEKVHGARLLEGLFQHFSEGKFLYNKVEHAPKLTDRIIEQAPNELNEIAELIVQVLDGKKTE
ncbi:MAG TPA: AAA family ATPase, partial [Aggregatilineales bacterium]|nr:AAA family ATPase [Aggregatilineales bacterium]